MVEEKQLTGCKILGGNVLCPCVNIEGDHCEGDRARDLQTARRIISVSNNSDKDSDSHLSDSKTEDKSL